METRGRKREDLTGKQFGRWTVISRAEDVNNRSAWLCRCECGTEKIVTTRNLTVRKSQSCGCYRRERVQEVNSVNKKKYNQFDLSGEYGVGISSRGNKFYFDLEDYDRIKDLYWCETNGGYISCSLPRNGEKQQHALLHRLVMDCPDDMQVDHINCDVRDNRKANLRICTREENNYFRTKEYKYKDIGKITKYFLKDYPELGGFETKDKALEELNKIKERENI